MINIKDLVFNLPRQYRTHQNADLSIEEYLAKYKSEFKKVSIGCSFAPDLVEQMYRLENGISRISDNQKLAILKILIQDFGMREIRLGVKWNKAVDEKGNFDFSYYHPYLDYCLSNNVNVCLNIGPIKTFGWPEEHIPSNVIETCSLTQDSTVHAGSPLAQHAFRYLDSLLHHLSTGYSKKQLENLTIIQPENELFNAFGKLRLRLSDEYISKVIHKIHKIFPDKKILLSSAESRDTHKIAQLIQMVGKQNSAMPNFICGINYYYNLPSFIHLPKIGPIDNITISNLVQRRTHSSNIKESRKNGYAIEVTEAQFEQWGRAYLSPGNSFHEAKYLFARIVENILDPSVGGLIRLWGFERYAKKKIENTLTYDHLDNIALIKKINAL